MIEIIIALGDNSKRFSRILYECISQSYKTSLYSNGLYKRTQNEADIVIIECNPKGEIYLPKGILVFPSHHNVDENDSVIKPEGNIIAIVSSGDKQAQEILAKSRIKTITYGLSSKDTVTASSITHDSAVISLQRNLTSFSGKIIEPVEIPIRPLEGQHSINELMIITAIKLLID